MKNTCNISKKRKSGVLGSFFVQIICNCLTCPCQGATVPQNRGQNGIYEGVWYNSKWEHISDSQKIGLLPGAWIR